MQTQFTLLWQRLAALPAQSAAYQPWLRPLALLAALGLVAMHPQPILVGVYGLLLLLSVSLAWSSVRQHLPDAWRPWLAMLIDCFASSLLLSLPGWPNTLGMVSSLLVLLAYGLNAGHLMRVMTTLWCLTGTLIGMVMQPDWLSQPALACGWLLTLLLCPLFLWRAQALRMPLAQALQQTQAHQHAWLNHLTERLQAPIARLQQAQTACLQSGLTVCTSPAMQSLQTATAQLNSLVSQLDHLRALERGEMPDHTEVFDLSALLHAQVQLFSAEADRKQLSLHCEVDAGVAPYYRGCPALLGLLIQPLMANAIQFTPHGAVKLALSSQVITTGNESCHQLCITIQDTGIGIPEAAIAPLFGCPPETALTDSVFSDDNTLAAHGLHQGFGLAIVQHVLRLLDAQLRVRSQAPGGTCITVTLALAVAAPVSEHQAPISSEQAATAPQPDNLIALASHARFQKKMRVLVADAQLVNRMLLNESLRRANCAVRNVESGEEALQALKEQPFDAVFLDDRLPDMPGIKVFERWRALSPADSAPIAVILLADNASTAMRTRALRSGLFEVLDKPVVSRQIQAVITAVKQQHAQQTHPDPFAQQLATSNAAASLFADAGASPTASALAHAPTVVSPMNRQPMEIPPVTSNILLTSGDRQTTASLPANATGLASTASTPLLELDRLQHLQRLAGGADGLSRLITDCVQTADALIRTLHTHCLALNLADVHNLAESLAYEAADMGLLALSQHCRALMGLEMAQAASVVGRSMQLAQCYQLSRQALLEYQQGLSAQRSYAKP